MAVLLISIIGTVLANRGSGDDNTNNTGDNDNIVSNTEDSNNTDDNSANNNTEQLGELDYHYLGFIPFGHDAVPNSNTPVTHAATVDSSVTDEQLDAYFVSEYLLSLGDHWEYSPLRVDYINKIEVYNYYEGIEGDYDIAFKYRSQGVYHGNEPLEYGGQTYSTREQVDEKIAELQAKLKSAERKTYTYEEPPLPEGD